MFINKEQEIISILIDSYFDNISDVRRIMHMLTKLSKSFNLSSPVVFCLSVAAESRLRNIGISYLKQISNLFSRLAKSKKLIRRKQYASLMQLEQISSRAAESELMFLLESKSAKMNF